MSSKVPFVALAASVATIACYFLTRDRWLEPRRKRVFRSLLPHDLFSWRNAGGGQNLSPYPDPWAIMRDAGFWEQFGYRLWLPHSRNSAVLCAYDQWGYPGTTLGHHFFPNQRAEGDQSTIFRLKNAMMRPARHSLGFDVVIRAVSAGRQGTSELEILRKLATGEHALRPENHVLAMFQEIVLDDIVFGVFPYIPVPAGSVFGRSTVGNMINIFLQTLEATAYIHKCLVAHQDLFLDNFLIEYIPSSPVNGAPALFPRVYLIDFETAVSFSADSRPEDRFVSGHYFGDNLKRPLALELKNKGTPFDPFALDVWQLAHMMIRFSTENDEIDEIVDQMHDDDPAVRPTAMAAYEGISVVYRRIPPVDLDIPVEQPPIEYPEGFFD